MSYNSSFDALDRFALTALLYDFYGALLTEKQSKIIELYFLEDFSLAEISEELGISRQAAGILIKRTERILKKYELKLGLARKHIENKGKNDEIIAALAEITDLEGIEAHIKTKIDNLINAISEE